MQLSVVVPCYNEEANLPLILQKFQEVIGDHDVEVVLVNNGSTDNSAAVLERLLPDFAFARVVTVPVNQGYGFGILSGLRAAKGEFIGWTHADLQTDPADVIKALDIITRYAKPEKFYIKGNRRGRPLTDQLFTDGMSLFETLYMGIPVHDINAQPNIFHRSFFNGWQDPPHDFSLDLYALCMAHSLGLEVVRFPVLFPERLHGESSWNVNWAAKWKFIRRTVEFSTRLKKQMKKAG